MTLLFLFTAILLQAFGVDDLKKAEEKKEELDEIKKVTIVVFDGKVFLVVQTVHYAQAEKF